MSDFQWDVLLHIIIRHKTRIDKICKEFNNVSIESVLRCLDSLENLGYITKDKYIYTITRHGRIKHAGSFREYTSEMYWRYRKTK